MTEFNWSAYSKWENRQECENEPQEEGCKCWKCVNLDRWETMREAKYEAMKDDR